MATTHWLEGLIANMCAERTNIPGYGTGIMRGAGWFGKRTLGQLFPLTKDQLKFSQIHGPADIGHSNLDWGNVAKYARQLRMEGNVVQACRDNLVVWEAYLNGIGAAGYLEDA